ncbi:MAG: hypothetical protein Kow006_16810 [Gammaproteobacteria bacterium]
MFEYDQELVEELLATDVTFRKLHEEHQQIKAKVREAEIGTLPMDDFTLARLKKEKLRCKDKMAAIIASHRTERA